MSYVLNICAFKFVDSFWTHNCFNPGATLPPPPRGQVSVGLWRGLVVGLTPTPVLISKDYKHKVVFITECCSTPNVSSYTVLLLYNTSVQLKLDSSRC